MELLAENSWILEIVTIVAGVAVLFVQLKSQEKLKRAEYIASTNDRLFRFNDILDTLFSLKERGDFEKLGKAQQERILDYFSVFEVIEGLRRNRVISADDIHYYFGGRFADLTSNRGLQDAIIFGECGDILGPVYSLHKVLVGVHSRKFGKAVALERFGDLEVLDKQLYRARCNY
jgi:hypothetical protein